MSSVASKHALIIALGGVSIAALFVWYYQAKRQEERNRKKSIVLKQETEKKVENEHEKVTPQSAVTTTTTTTSKKSKRNKKLSESQNEQVGKKEEAERSEQSSSNVTVPSTQEIVVENDEKIGHVETTLVPTVTVETSEQVEAEIAEEKQKEEEEKAKVLVEQNNGIFVESGQGDSEEIQIGGEEVKPEVVVEEESVQKVEVQKTQAAPPAPIEMPKKRQSENEQIPEEPTPTKVLDQPLSLDIGAQMSPASFSWSEEMERSYMEGMNESSDMEASPISPAAHKSAKNTRPNKGRKGRGSGSQSGNKRGPARRLHSVEERAGDSQQNDEEVIVQRNGVVFDTAEHGDHSDDVGYDKSDSPGLASQNSEASSQDSGRATGGLASSLSPMDENGQIISDDINDLLPMYEFEIPNSLVGLIIGVKGKTIKELSVRTNVRMLIRQHHTPEKVKTHQICQVRGKRDEINHCLQMLRRRFPSPRFPELNLQPVLPPPLPNNSFDMLSTQPTWLTLPEEIKCEAAVCSVIDPSHFFIHQPSHPSFNSLCHLDMYMLRLYGEHSNLPELPTPCQNGLLCAAPVVNAWFRAVTVQYYEETDEVFVKFVDYGGYSKMARQDLRQIRTDLMSLPFQSTEVMLAHVRPVDGTTNWSNQAMEEFRSLCMGSVISAKLVGYAIDTKIPMIELYVPVTNANGEVQEIRFDQHLMEKGLARTADPSKMARPSTASIAATQIGAKRPSLSTQTSQTTVAC